MKKFLLSTIILGAANAISAQSPTTMQVNLKDGQTFEYTIADIESLTFTGNQPVNPETKIYSINIPLTFENSYVQKVMAGGKQIAEIDREYIKSINKQVTVIYPCDENGKADLTKGVSTTGASVVWDLDKNTATVGDDVAEEISSFYLVEGEIRAEAEGETTSTIIVADMIVDRRASQTETYSIVKIGTQYWMAENLRATHYTNGTPIDAISETEPDAWSANTSGAYLTNSNADWVKLAGLLYNGYCVTNENGIAPEGWAVPTQKQLTALRSAGNLKAANFRSTEELTWASGTVSNNMTGFSAIATGYYSTATGLNSEFSETWFWSSTKYYDAFSKGDNIDTLRVTSTPTGNVVVSNSSLGGHLLTFGHAIRCIRL